MRVRILTETDLRGVYATTLLMYKKLSEAGIEVNMYTTFKSDFNYIEPPREGKLFGREAILNSEKYSSKVLSEIKPEKGSIIHLANAWHGIIPLAEKMGVKTVINVQYWWPTCYFNSMEENFCDCRSITKLSKCIGMKKKGMRSYTSLAEAYYAVKKMERIKANVSSASAIIAVSKVVKDVLVSRGFPEDKIRIINVNALASNIDYVPYTPSSKFTFAYLSYPDREKGVFQLLHAFAYASKKNPNIRLKIPGGLESSEVISTVRDLGIEKSVEMTKRVPYEKYLLSLKQILADVDFVVVPSLYIDTWGRVVIESMLAGRPTIVTKGNGGLIEQVNDGVDGYHVNTYDIKEFGEALYKVSLMPREEVRKMGLIARDNASKKFDNKVIIDQLISTYKEIL
ncbi:glycosyltransferase family 4 protein [Sulfuracidifex tepidarius]|uniref:D-inositol-3-phosphate glycosyltransferase n=1 Tax=Sulfuracidifex tepidarius TaxID=1294262 RepID=A0A510E597_9CREN|nr:glycosyltransferase family 4 protein [Sulfuracidifex tepidarius]BBG24874.1 D-inositol-3-phosphate glycosyltransferase [Sulfuracidifex tepidarius]BBG27659.1 D-inositol-3-phosphate glycosyltransferase [Sulfuracidifex tepidarius]